MSAGTAVNDQAAYLRQASVATSVRIPARLRCLAVGSGKGGVGKTAISVGLSYALAKMGHRVLLIDADLGLANIDLQIGINPTHTLQDVVFGNCSLAEAVVEQSDGPDVLPSSSGTADMVEMGAARRQLFVEELIRFAAGYEYLIIDTAAGIGDSITAFMRAVPEVIVVVANEPTSIMDAYSLIKVLLTQETPPNVAIVTNMTRSLDEGATLAEHLNNIVERFLNVRLPVAGCVPFDEHVRDAIRHRRPTLLHAPNCAAAFCMQEIAQHVATSSIQLSRQPLSAAAFESIATIASPRGRGDTP
jgi:flagellar biosynthesis protein FlhG